MCYEFDQHRAVCFSFHSPFSWGQIHLCKYKLSTVYLSKQTHWFNMAVFFLYLSQSEKAHGHHKARQKVYLNKTRELACPLPDMQTVRLFCLFVIIIIIIVYVFIHLFNHLPI